MALNATYWSFCTMNNYVIAIPYTQDPTKTAVYLWASQGTASEFTVPTGSPGCRVGDVAAQFLFTGDIYQNVQQIIQQGTGSQTVFTGTLPTPIADGGTIQVTGTSTVGTFLNGTITGTGVSGTVNIATGAFSVTFTTAPTTGQTVNALYLQPIPYRCQWSGIGNPTLWPTPQTNAALAVLSGYNDLDPSAGQVMAITGYPQYALVFQRYAITRASFIGGQTTWQWQPFEFKRGLIGHGAFVKVGASVYFLSDEGLFVTDGSNVSPVGTDAQNDQGIDGWFRKNVNYAALDAIRMAFDAATKSIWMAIPTGTSTAPDTLLSFNLIAGKWSRNVIPSQCIWTWDNGTDGNPGTIQSLGLFDNTNSPAALTGPPLPCFVETQDMWDATGSFRILTGAFPLYESPTGSVTMTVGVRDSLAQPVTYADTQPVDAFSQMSPIIGDGRFIRIRLDSLDATNIQGATIMTQPRRS